MLRTAFSRARVLSGAGSISGPFTAAAQRCKTTASQDAELSKFLYGYHPAPSIEDEVKKGNVPSDGGMPNSANKQHYHFFKNPIYTREQVQDVKITHRPAAGVLDKAALAAVGFARSSFDKITGYPELKTERDWINRVLFLETVAGVPGFVAAQIRHFRSLRKLQRDQGWIHTLLEEAENERMHLLTFMHLKQPGILFRLAVLVTQGIFANAFFVTYVISPKLAHRFVGYLEEEAVRTYTHALALIDEPGSPLHEWNVTPAPPLAIEYWRLPPDATMRLVVEMVRADEACHRHVNHVFSSIDVDQRNPFGPDGKTELDIAPCEKVVEAK